MVVCAAFLDSDEEDGPRKINDEEQEEIFSSTRKKQLEELVSQFDGSEARSTALTLLDDDIRRLTKREALTHAHAHYKHKHTLACVHLQN